MIRNLLITLLALLICFTSTHAQRIETQNNPDTIFSIKIESIKSIDKFLSQNDVKEWIDGIEKDRIEAHKLSDGLQNYLILKSTIFAATGLASNFYSFLFFNIDTQSIVVTKEGFLSLSCAPSNFYIKNNTVYAIKYEFGDKFYVEKDYANVPVDQIVYVIEGNNIRKIASSPMLLDDINEERRP